MPSTIKLFSSPGRVLLSSTIVTIIIGTFLLSLPQAQLTPHHFVDLFFTATSATCVTGFLTIPLESFTPFGQTIILLLMQIGGLGLITLSVFLLSLFLNIGMGTEFMAHQLLDLDSRKSSRHIIIFIGLFTLIVESIGTVFIYCAIKNPALSFKQNVFTALFQAVSSFCNVGFTLLPGGMSAHQTNYFLLYSMTVLMLMGGFGFIVWRDIGVAIRAYFLKKRFLWSLHTRIVFQSTTILIGASIIILGILEYTSLIYAHPISSLHTLIFNSISYHGAGFSTINPHLLHPTTLLFIIIIAFIGSSPGSTGSGIKVTTFTLILATIYAVVKRSSNVNIKGRRIPNDLIFKAVAIVAMSIAWIVLTLFCLLITEQSQSFIDLFFAAVSGLTNLGLEHTLTTHFSAAGKYILIIAMLIGRIGSLTLILALKRRTEKVNINYPEERIMIG